MTRTRRTLAAGIAAALLVLTAGCSAGQDGTAVVGADTAPTSGDKAADTKTTTAKKLPEGVYRFGSTVKFEDGSTLTVSRPVRFKRAEYAAGGEDFKQSVKFKIRFTNKSKEVFDPTLTSVLVTSGETEGQQIFQEGLNSPESKLLPGRSVAWVSGFGVPNAKKVTLQVNVGFLEYEDAIFTNEPV